MVARIRIEQGDMLAILPRLAADGFRPHACVTDPPYHLTSIVKRFGSPTAKAPRAGKDGASTGVFKRGARGFMGKAWDGGDIAFRPDTWRAVWRVLPPGGHLLAFCGTRSYHRMACAVEDAGFEIRDAIAWLYGTGFPKRPDVLKPAMELIAVGRKPIRGSVASNVVQFGTGGLNVEACRVGERERPKITDAKKTKNTYGAIDHPGGKLLPDARWPANVVHDGSAEVVDLFPDSTSNGGTAPVSTGRSIGTFKEKQNRPRTHHHDDGSAARFFFSPEPDPPDRVRRELKRNPKPGRSDGYGMDKGAAPPSGLSFGDNGSAARFFYSAKADTDERLASKHPTIKPVDLMRWLVRLVTPPRGMVLDPFAGSGTTGMACMAEGFDAVLIERESEYIADIRARLAHVRGDDTPLFGQREMFGGGLGQ